ncbi:MAG: DUF1295 domain-containing protein [Kiritimatiellae bacterium]|nr:DUF1295 domain-containing protein [Kiritimatiellia bacterium]MDW8458971.1 DUF1295 domain-containing protein [Verrucomicrobiota bacterium]
MNGWMLMIEGCAAAMIAMVFLWLIQRRIGNAGIVDVAWAAGIGSLFVIFAALGEGPTAHRLAIAIMGGLWGLRLAVHIHRRGHGKPEDGRYAELRRKWGPDFQPKLLAFYQLQALTIAFFSLPAALISTSPSDLVWAAWNSAGLIIWAVGWIGEWIADAQLEAFKRDPMKTESVCQRGLWRYSRHPNYFFEWLVWVGIAIFCLPAPQGWLAAACPAAMLYVLLRVTGIPATEAQALRSKGEAYRRYQQQTSMFVPWPPRKDVI